MEARDTVHMGLKQSSRMRRDAYRIAIGCLTVIGVVRSLCTSVRQGSKVAFSSHDIPITDRMDLVDFKKTLSTKEGFARIVLCFRANSFGFKPD